ncbi:MAG: hypothetical protein IKV61_05540 [Clostridia bacterium]|nr:hypothetical protein [Clostridia bacterium]
MKNYLIICTVSITFFTLLENLLINGKLKNMLRSVFSIICILIIINPIANVFNGSINLSGANFNLNFTEELIDIEENTVKIEVKNLLNKNNIEVKNVIVTANNDSGNVSIKKIKVFLSSKVINENGEHIHLIKQVEELLKNNCYNCELEVLIEE